MIRLWYSGSLSFPIADADTSLDQFRIPGDHTARFPGPATIFSVTGSTGNDGDYAGSSSSYDGGDDETVIQVSTVLDATADGTITLANVNSALTADAFDLPITADEEYPQRQLAEVEDSDGYLHTIDKRSGSERQPRAITLTVPSGYLAKTNGLAISLKAYLRQLLRRKTQIEIFDDELEVAYKAKLSIADPMVTRGNSLLADQFKTTITLRFIISGSGEYGNFATRGSAVYAPRP